MNAKILSLGVAFTLLATAALHAQNPGQTGVEASGVQSRRGDASPVGGFSAGETNSRVDDYLHQDEQINVDPADGVVKVLRTNQKALINDYVTWVFPIRNAASRELRNVFRTITALEGGRAENIRDKESGEEFMQVIAPKFQMPFIEAALAELDVEWLLQDRDGSASGRYYPQYRPAETIDVFASIWGGEGATAVDRFRNMVLRRDEPYRVEAYLKAAALVDQPPPNGLLKFTIYEVDTSNDLKLGVDWIAWKNGPGRALFELIFADHESHHAFDNATGFFDPNLGAGGVIANGENDVHFASSQYLLSANYLLTSAFIDFLRVKGKARVIAEPEVYVFNRQVATWSSESQFLSFQVSPNDVDAEGIKPSRLNDGSDFSAHNRFLDYGLGPIDRVGLELEVFPAIGLESSEVEIFLQSTDLAGVTPLGTPIITNRSIVTKVRLVDGQPFVFGGLTRTEDVDTANKAPWLGDIPVLGYLFGQETNSSRRKELIVTVVPHFYQGAPQAVTEPLELDTIAMASGEKPITLPQNSFGFDMWLFDEVEK